MHALSVFRPRARGGDGRIIQAASRLAANQAHFIEHPPAIARDFQLAALDVIPAHGYLAQREFSEIGQINQLDIEAEAINRRGLNEGATDVHPKSLEAALRVPEGQACGEPDDEIEDTPALLASPGLMHADQTAIKRARAES